MQNTNTQERLLRLPEVRVRTGLSRSSIYENIAGGDFPSPVKLGRRISAWPESEIAGWIEAQKATRGSAD